MIRLTTRVDNFFTAIKKKEKKKNILNWQENSKQNKTNKTMKPLLNNSFMRRLSNMSFNKSVHIDSTNCRAIQTKNQIFKKF